MGPLTALEQVLAEPPVSFSLSHLYTKYHDLDEKINFIVYFEITRSLVTFTYLISGLECEALWLDVDLSTDLHFWGRVSLLSPHHHGHVVGRRTVVRWWRRVCLGLTSPNPR